MASDTLPERPAPIDLPSLPAPVNDFISYLCQNPTKNISTIVEPYKAYESELRKIYAQQPDHEAIKDGAVNLVPIFSGHESDLKVRARDLENESKEESEKYIMPLKEKERRPNGSPAVVGSIKDFQTNFNLFSESSLADLDWSNVVAAGSAVTTSLLPIPEKWAGSKRAMREYYHEHLAPASDVDLFLYGLTEAEGLEKIKQIETNIKDAILHETTTIRTKNAITIASQHPTRHVQIVLRLYDSISQIITGFDVDCSCAAYDGKQVYMSPRAVGSFITQCNTVDLTRRSPSYENRLSKYSHRGFEVHWPMLDRSRIDPTIFERSFGRTEGLARLLILEKLPKTVDRENYMDQRRKERGRPSLNRGFRNQRRLYGNLKDQEEDEVADWAEQDEIANYHTMTVPYGQKYNAAKINRLLYAKDLLLNAEWNQDKDREVYLHRHPCFFGTAEEVLQDCCGYCPVPTTDKEKEVAEKESKNNVSGTLKFITDDPGRQEIGSFNPINDDEWTTMSYVGDTARLCQAIVDGDLEHVQDWCSQEGVDVNRRDFTGRTPLHLATITSTPEIVKCLVDHGARMIARLVDGRTALHIAAARGDLEMIRILLNKSMANEEEEEAKESHKFAVTGSENEEESDSASEITLDSEQEESDALTMGSFVKIPGNKDEAKDDVAAVMDDSMEDPDIYDINVIAWDYGLSPLHLAILNGHIDAIKLLVSEYGADVLFPVKLVEAGTTNPRGAIMTLVLAMSLPKEKSKQVVEVLLNLGATSAQSDTNHFTALHYIVAQNNTDILEVLFAHDQPAAQRVINKIGMTGSHGSADTPLSTAIKKSYGEMASKLLHLGAQPQFEFDDWVKVYTGMNTHAKKQNTETNMKRFQESAEQPIIAAICKEMGAVVGDLISNGANPQTLTTVAWSVVNNPDIRNYYHYRKESILDVIQHKLQTLREWKEPVYNQWQYQPENLKSRKPEILQSETFYTTDLEPGTYKYWTALKDYQYEKYQNKLKHENYEKLLKDKETELEKYKNEREAIGEAIKDLEQAEKLLTAAGAKSFTELYPDISESSEDHGRSRRHNRHAVAPEPYKTHFTFNVPDLNDGKRQGYFMLFEAAWNNDLDTIKNLTLGPWKHDNVEYPPLRIAVRDGNEFMPFSIAVLRGHYDLARRIVEICLAQYHNEEDEDDKKVRQRWGITTSDDDDDDDDGSDDLPIFSELVTDKFTIDTLEEVSNVVKGDTLPLTMIQWHCSAHRSIENDENSGSSTTFTLFQHAIEQDDFKMFKFLLDIASEQKALMAKHEDDQRFYSFDASIFNVALSKGRTTMMAEMIKRCGAGVPLGTLVSSSGVELKTKPRYYEGLSIGGKKRKDWARPPAHTRTYNPFERQFPPLLEAAHMGNIESVEWFMSDAPMRHYKEFAERNKDDLRIRTLESGKGFESTISNWLEMNNELLLHVAILHHPPTDKGEINHLNLVKHLVSVLPDSALSLKSAQGFSPLHLAVSRKNIPIIEYLLSVGASPRSRDRQNRNIMHTLAADARSVDKETISSLESIIKLLDKKDVQEMLLERSDDYPSAVTPLALWMSKAKRHDSVDFIELLLKYSTGEELEMINGEGDLPLHVAIKIDRPDLTSFLLRQKPTLLYRESATGRTPLEMSHDNFISNFISNPPSVYDNWHYHPNNADRDTLSAYRAKQKHDMTQKYETHSMIWEECLRVQGDLKRKFDNEDGNGEGKTESMFTGKRRLVSLFEANEVARRLAGSHKGKGNVPMYMDVVGQWM
ncbi:putative ankyrin repeat protein [Botrytis cinerea BcDW1]|uniref:Putative ankyrin repeat protein n=1 Tax=Botryotinia fuckeliana (strain BcDW1) TaxID=1290391 RepID=M7U474_BOTF1|nr:putative ankyrin repeat protein [Botrytis cinerea BcDW1]